MDLGVFRRSSSTTSKPVVRCDLAFDDTTESSREPSVSPPRDRRRSRFARLRPGAIRSTAAPRDSTKPASHEVLHPSGDFIVEVRITWVCLTQHLPPLGFLNPSTDFSFHDLSALFQTDATYGVQRTGADLPGYVRVRRRSRPEGCSPRDRGTLRTAQTTKVDCDRATSCTYRRRTLSAKPSIGRPPSSRHSPRSLRTKSKGGGRNHKLPEFEPT